jgi:ATP-dependent RNA helicase DeaD
MVATDIAARGIDISDLSHVVNYSLPEDPAVFLHRVGRTGRIGKKGTSLSIVSGAEIHTLTVLEKKFGLVFERKQLPPPEEARKRWSDRHVAELKEAMSATIFEAFIPLAQDLRGRPDGEYLMAFALKYFFTHHRIEKMTDVQKAEHKRAEHERKERHEAAAKKESAARERGDRGGRGDRERGRDRDRDRDRGPDRSERRPPREERGPRSLEARGPRTVEVEAVAPAGDAGAEAEGDRSQRPRIFFTLGEQDGADEAKVREAVASLAPGVELRAVEVRRGHSYLEVAPEALDGTVQALNGKDWNGKALTAEKARRRRR